MDIYLADGAEHGCRPSNATWTNTSASVVDIVGSVIPTTGSMMYYIEASGSITWAITAPTLPITLNLAFACAASMDALEFKVRFYNGLDYLEIYVGMGLDFPFISLYLNENLISTRTWEDFETDTWFVMSVQIDSERTSVYIDGERIVAYSASDNPTHTTITSTIDSLKVINGDSSFTLCLDDIVIYGSEYSGITKIIPIVVNGDISGSINHSTSEIGDHYALVNDSTIADISTYIHVVSGSQIDLYSTSGFSDPTGWTTGEVLGVSVWLASQASTKDDVGNIEPYLKIAGVDYLSGSSSVYDILLSYQGIYETNPATSGDWQASDLYSLYAGVKSEMTSPVSGSIQTAKVIIEVISLESVEARTSTFLSGGYDFRMTIPIIEDGEYIAVKSSVAIKLKDTESFVLFRRSGDILYIDVCDQVLTTMYSYPSSGSSTIYHSVKVVWHGSFCTVYIDDHLENSFIFDYIDIPDSPSVSIVTSDGWSTDATIQDILFRELSTWREAVYIDLEATGLNAVGSIIQERPIDILTGSDGSVRFSYNQNPDIEPVYRLERINRDEVDTADACSDAIVYFQDVGMAFDNEYFDDYGFLSKVMRLPNIERDATVLAKLMLKRARERQNYTTLAGRPNFNFETGDVAYYYETLVNGWPILSGSAVVEAITFDFEDGNTEMIIEGREL